MRLSLVCVLFDPAIPTSFFNFIQLFLPRAHAQGVKVIGRVVVIVVVVVIVSTKIAMSRGLGT